MNEEIMQGMTGDPVEGETTPEIEDVTPDESAAVLSFANTLQERFMEQEAAMAGVEASEEQESAPQDEETNEMVEDPAAEEQAPEQDIEALVEAKVEEKMSVLREELTSALAEDDDTTEKE